MKVIVITVNTAITYTYAPVVAGLNATARPVVKMDIQHTTHPMLVNDDLIHDDLGLQALVMALAAAEVLKHPNLNTPGISNQTVVFQEIIAVADAFLNVTSYGVGA